VYLLVDVLQAQLQREHESTPQHRALHQANISMRKSAHLPVYLLVDVLQTSQAAR
jgi:hypothetical protein